jgi:dTDP-4-amino-4,6-dideoxygalactose transaminase
MADVDAIRRAAPGVSIVEDCAQAFGSRRDGRAAGTLGELAAFSFYPTKNLGALGDAGFLAGDPERVARARRLRDYGRDASGAAVELGTLSRMDELQAAALRVKLLHLGAALARRRALAAAYDAALPAPLSRVGRHTEGEPALHLYVVRVKERARVRAALEEAGIETGVHYPTPLHLMPAFAGARHTSLAITEVACDEVLSLPFISAMRLEDVAEVCAVLESAC